MKKFLITIIIIIVVGFLFFVNLNRLINFYSETKTDPQCKIVAGCCHYYCVTTKESSIDLDFGCEEFCPLAFDFKPICEFKNNKCSIKPDIGLIKWYKSYRANNILRKWGLFN